MSLRTRLALRLLGTSTEPQSLARYLTLGGAHVHITPYRHPTTPHTRRWSCDGCGDTHAGQCRAIPPGGAR